MIKRFLPWIIGGAYFLCPYDVLPDFIFGPGWLDDLAVLGLMWWWNGKRKKAGSGSLGGGGRRTRHVPNGTEDSPYDVLGVSQGASPEQIRSAYKRLVAQYHPDKVQYLGPEFQKLAHEKFVAVQEAYEKLKT